MLLQDDNSGGGSNDGNLKDILKALGNPSGHRGDLAREERVLGEPLSVRTTRIGSTVDLERLGRGTFKAHYSEERLTKGVNMAKCRLALIDRWMDCGYSLSCYKLSSGHRTDLTEVKITPKHPFRSLEESGYKSS